MLPSSELGIISFSKSARVTKTKQKYGKTKVIEVNRIVSVEILFRLRIQNSIIPTVLEAIYTHAQKLLKETNY